MRIFRLCMILLIIAVFVFLKVREYLQERYWKQLKEQNREDGYGKI